MAPTPRTLRLTLGAVKVVVAGAAAAVALTGGPATMTVGPDPGFDPGPVADAAPAPAQGRIDQLMAAHHCSTDGLGPDVVPGSAIIERGSQVLVVSFDDGWAVYTGAAPGTLVALCLDPV